MNFRDYLKQQQTVFGVFCKTADPFFIEALGKAGFDFVILDNEHGPNDKRSLYPLILAAERAGTYPIVRVEALAAIEIQRTLDLNPAAVQIPQIQSRQDALNAVHFSKYHPQGMRGMCCYVRGADYGLKDRQAFFAQQNETSVIIHIEGTSGVEALDEIIDVPGLDVIFIGPNDLSQSMGLPGQTDHPDVLAAIETVVKKCQARDKFTGIFAGSLQDAQRYKQLGVHYIAYSVDVGIFAQACQDLVSQLRAL